MLARVTDLVVVRNLLLVDSLHELPNDEGHALYPLNLLLRSDELSLEAPVCVSGAGSLPNEKQVFYLCSSLMYSSCRLIYLVIDQPI